MTDNQKDILRRAAAFCAYQERTQQEVRERLKEWEVVGEEAEWLISELIEQNYLNEERFARTFAGSKFRVKRWGKHKIRQHLKQRGITGHNLEQAMKEIETDDYRETLRELLEKKKRTLAGEHPLVMKQKLARYAIGKGYEPELVFQLVNERISE